MIRLYLEIVHKFEIMIIVPIKWVSLDKMGVAKKPVIELAIYPSLTILWNEESAKIHNPEIQIIVIQWIVVYIIKEQCNYLKHNEGKWYVT